MNEPNQKDPEQKNRPKKKKYRTPKQVEDRKVKNTVHSQGARAITRASLESVKNSVPPEIAKRTIDNIGKNDGGVYNRTINAMVEWVRMEQQRANAAEAREQTLKLRLLQVLASASLMMTNEVSLSIRGHGHKAAEAY